MRPYWITVERQPLPSPLNLGIGITANSENDARKMLFARFGNGIRIVEITAISSAGELEQEHVVPNMGNWLQRGVWFPLAN